MHDFFRISSMAAVLILVALSLAPNAHAASSATFTVNSDLDEVDKKPGDVLCISKPSKKCTLRAAIMEANALGGKRTIKLPAGTYFLSRPGTGEDKAKTGDLDIKAQITINGADANTTIIDGSGIDRVFDIHAGTLTLNKVTVRNGNSGAEEGGGGVYVRAGTLKTKLTRISFNTTNPPAAYGKGGGIYSKGKVILVQTLLNDNAGGDGAAIYNDGGRLEMTASLVYHNQASRAGTLRSEGTTLLTNSTLSENQGGVAGAIYAGTGTVSLYNVTIASNSASSGGGIKNIGASVYLRNTIIEANNATDGPACDGTLTSGDYNIVGYKDSFCTIIGTTSHDQYNTFPSLYTLRDDGGFTWTHPLLASSPAVDGGNPAGCKDQNSANLTTDQRGMTRPKDGDGVDGARCDIGASELQP